MNKASHTKFLYRVALRASLIGFLTGLQPMIFSSTNIANMLLMTVGASANTFVV